MKILYEHINFTLCSVGYIIRSAGRALSIDELHNMYSQLHFELCSALYNIVWMHDVAIYRISHIITQLPRKQNKSVEYKFIIIFFFNARMSRLNLERNSVYFKRIFQLLCFSAQKIFAVMCSTPVPSFLKHLTFKKGLRFIHCYVAYMLG